MAWDSAALRSRLAVVARENGSGGAGCGLLPGRPWWRGDCSLLAAPMLPSPAGAVPADCRLLLAPRWI
jgi:hypothetical protein